MRYTYNKLVRDKIPENIDKKEGRKSHYRVLNDKEYLEELNKKVIEEANEFVEENAKFSNFENSGLYIPFLK